VIFLCIPCFIEQAPLFFPSPFGCEPIMDITFFFDFMNGLFYLSDANRLFDALVDFNRSYYFTIDYVDNHCYCSKEIDVTLLHYWILFDASHWSLLVPDHMEHYWSFILKLYSGDHCINSGATVNTTLGDDNLMTQYNIDKITYLRQCSYVKSDEFELPDFCDPTCKNNEDDKQIISTHFMKRYKLLEKLKKSYPLQNINKQEPNTFQQFGAWIDSSFGCDFSNHRFSNITIMLNFKLGRIVVIYQKYRWIFELGTGKYFMTADDLCFNYDEDWITEYYYILNLKHWLLDAKFNEATQYYQFFVDSVNCERYPAQVQFKNGNIDHLIIYKDKQQNSIYLNSTRCFVPNDNDFNFPTNCKP